MELVLVKLGGSLITDKSGVESFRADVVARLAREIVEARVALGDRGVVLGHGSGSFGHVAATGSGLVASHRVGAAGEGSRPVEPEASNRAAARVQDAAGRLHRLVIRELLEAGVDAASLAPGSFMTRSGGRLRHLSDEALELALRRGAVPVVYGDVVRDAEVGAVICSTETVLCDLSQALLARGHRIARAVWAGVTDGLLDAAGKRVPELTPERLADGAAGGSAGTDVTGGMRHRIDAALALARLGVESLLIDGTVADGLRRAMVEGFPAGGGTRVPPIPP